MGVLDDLIHAAYASPGGMSSTGTLGHTNPAGLSDHQQWVQDQQFDQQQRAQTEAIANTTNTTVNRANNRYIDIPSDKEFYNNFGNSYGAHLDNLRKSGQLLGPEVDWLLQNQDLVYSMFQGEIARRNAAGEKIYGLLNEDKEISEVVKKWVLDPDDTTATRDKAGNVIPGTGKGKWVDEVVKKKVPWNTPTLLNSIPGAGETSTSNSQRQMTGPDGQLLWDTDPVTGAAVPRMTTSTNNTTINTTEHTYTREKEAIGYNYSPFKYLTEQSPAGNLKILYEGMKGAKLANQRVGSGVSAKPVY